MTEYGMAMEVTADALDGALVDGVPVSVRAALENSYAVTARERGFPEGEPSFLVGPTRMVFHDVPCPDTGLLESCPHISPVDAIDDDDDYLWPHREPTGEILHSFAWYRMVG